MTKPKTKASPKTRVGTNHVSPPKPAPTQAPTTQPHAPAPTDVVHPETPLAVAISRAIDQELDWFFAYAEGALHREDVAILPSYAAVRILATSPTDEDVRARAAELAYLVQVCLVSLRAPHASVLRAAYTPRRWPARVRSEFKHLSGVVVRLTLPDELWPAKSGHHGLEEAAASRLSFTLASTTAKRPFARVRARAEGLLGRAVVAYSKARSQEGLALAL